MSRSAQRKRTRGIVGALLLAVGGAQASEGWDLVKDAPRKLAEPFEIRGMVVRPAGWLHDPDSRWQIDLQGHGSGGVESERHVDSQPEDGSTGLVDAMVGARVQRLTDLGMDLRFDGQLGRTYRLDRTFAKRDLTYGTIEADAAYDATEWYVRGRADARRLREPEFLGDEPVKRTEAGIGGTIGRGGPGIIPELDVDYRALRYLDDTRLFTAEGGSHRGPSVAFRLGWRSRLDNYLHGLVGADRRTYRRTEPFNDSTGVRFGIGWRGLVDAVEGFAQVGIETRRYDRTFRDDPSYADRSVTVPWAEAKVIWNFEIDHTLAMFFRSRIEDGRSSNGDWRVGPRVQYNLRLRRDLLAHGTLGYEAIIASGPPDGDRRRAHAESAALWIDWLYREGLTLGARLSADQNASNVESRYQRIEASVGTSVLF